MEGYFGERIQMYKESRVEDQPLTYLFLMARVDIDEPLRRRYRES